MSKLRKNLSEHLLWLIWAIGYALVVPTYNVSVLIWFIFIPVLVYAYKKPLKKTLKMAFFYSMIYWLMTLYWLTAFDGVSMPFIVPIYSTYYAFLFLIIVILAKRFPKVRFLIFPTVWTVGELIRSTGYFGFKWNLVGDALWHTPQLMQTADIWGIYGVSFLVLLVNAALAEWVMQWIQSQDMKKGFQKAVVPLSVVLFLFSFNLIYGINRYNYYSRMTKQARKIRLALFQPNFGSFDPWWRERWKYYGIIWKMHAEAALDNPDLMVWSEVMMRNLLWPYLNYYPDHPNRVYVERYLDLPNSFNVPVLMTHPMYSNRKFYNSADLVKPHQSGYTHYAKIHLTPFGEWFPLYQYIPIVNTMMEKLGAGAYSPAKNFTIFHLKKSKFAVLICFEDVFALMARKFVKKGVNYFVNETNDGWAYRWNVGSDLPLWQHVAGVVGVAISVRRPIARAVNTGVSGIVDANGHFRPSKTPIYKRGVDVDEIAVIDSNIKTIYVCFGYLFPYFLLVIVVSMLAWMAFFDAKSKNILKKEK